LHGEGIHVEQGNGEKFVVDHQTPFSSLHVLMASKFLLGLCPKILENQISKSLRAAAARTRHSTEAHIMLFQMSDYQKVILVDNRYALNEAWTDMWGHKVGSNFAYCLI
jgi:hypothetical protein